MKLLLMVEFSKLIPGCMSWQKYVCKGFGGRNEAVGLAEEEDGEKGCLNTLLAERWWEEFLLYCKLLVELLELPALLWEGIMTNIFY